jgi:hypothetical protein
MEMPIEFTCPECRRLLRVPEQSAGKKAKCPSCGAIVAIPSDTPPTTEEDDISTGPSQVPAPSQSAANPFADVAPGGRSVGSFADEAFDPENPYASSAAVAVTPSATAHPKAGVRPTRFTFGDVLNHTWAVYTDQLGICIVVTLLLIGLGIVAYIAAAAVVVGILAAVAQANDPALLLVIVPLVIVGVIAAFVGITWLQLGLSILMIRISRGQPAQMNDLFSGGPYLMRGIGLALIVLLINAGVILFCKIPFFLTLEPVVDVITDLASNVITYIISLFLFLCIYLIVDRDMGVIESIENSARFMHGNKLTLFLVHLVVGTASVVLTVVTCGIGLLFVMPFWMVLCAVVYLLATGQPTALHRRSAFR